MYNGGMNTGAAYMARRGWDKTPSSQGSISFHGSSRKKVVVIVALAVLGLLLLGAIIIIILFSVGVIPRPDPIILTTTSPTNLGPRLETRIYRCQFTILRQAEAAYNEQNSRTYQTAVRMLQDALSYTLTQSTLAVGNPVVTVTDLTNQGEDLQVDFSLRLTTAFDNSVVQSVLRSQKLTIEGRLGGNSRIADNSIQVVS